MAYIRSEEKLHREMKQEAATRGLFIQDVLVEAWKYYKAAKHPSSGSDATGPQAVDFEAPPNTIEINSIQGELVGQLDSFSKIIDIVQDLQASVTARITEIAEGRPSKRTASTKKASGRDSRTRKIAGEKR